MNRDAKKRIMFLPSDDFNFLAYSIIIVLQTISCKSEKKLLVDIRKLAPISSIIPMPHMEYLIFDSPESHETKKMLPKLWAQTKKKEPLLHRITYALEKRDIIGVQVDQKRGCIGAFLKDESIGESLVESTLFNREIRNVGILMQKIPRIRTIKYQTLMERLLPYSGTIL